MPYLEFILYSSWAPSINILLTQKTLPSGGASRLFLIAIYQGHSQESSIMMKITYVLKG